MPHRLFVLLFGILFIGLLPGSARQSPDKICHKLDSIQNYRTEFTYTVTLPLTDSEINYRAELSYRKNPIDTLCGYSYLIAVVVSHKIGIRACIVLGFVID